jgi:hypothetical protein
MVASRCSVAWACAPAALCSPRVWLVLASPPISARSSSCSQSAGAADPPTLRRVGTWRQPTRSRWLPTMRGTATTACRGVSGRLSRRVVPGRRRPRSMGNVAAGGIAWLLVATLMPRLTRSKSTMLKSTVRGSFAFSSITITHRSDAKCPTSRGVSRPTTR